METLEKNRMSKRKSKLGFKSLGVKVSIIISLILLFVLGLKGIYDGVASYHLAISNAKELETEQTRKLANDLEKTFTGAYQSARAIETFVQSTIENVPIENRKRDVTLKSIEKVLLNNDNIFGVGIFFEPNAFDGKDDFLGAFADLLEQESGVVSVKKGIDYLDKIWYTEAMKSKTTVLSDPMMDNGRLMAIYSIPIMENNVPVGVVTADILKLPTSK